MRRLRQVSIAFLFLASAGKSYAESMTVREYADRWVHFYADRFGVPAELGEAFIKVESNWNPLALSDKGAKGLMQLMPETAARFQVKNPFNIPENIRGGLAYIALLLRRFDGDLRLVIAAYIAGETPIGARRLAYSSREVHDYVVQVLRVYNTTLAAKYRRVERRPS